MRPNRGLVALITALFLFAAAPGSASVPSLIGLVVDGRFLTPETPPALVDGRVLVPLRFVAETLRLSVTWNPDDYSITLTSHNVQAWLQIGNARVVVNGAVANLDVAPRLIGNRAMVPLRFIAEATGAAVHWDAPNQTVRITASNSIATGGTGPTLPTPGTPAGKLPKLAPGAVIDLSLIPLPLPEADVLAEWGAPALKLTGFYEMTWSLYSPQPGSLVMAGIRNGHVVAVYAMGPAWSVGSVDQTMTPSRAAAHLQLKPSFDLDWGGDTYAVECETGSAADTLPPLVTTQGVTVLYTDAHDNRVAGATVYTADAFVQTNGIQRHFCRYSYYGEPLPTPAEAAAANLQAAWAGEARIQLEVTNAERVGRGLEPLAWSDPLARVAQSHSRDMADHAFFDHHSPNTGSLRDRLQTAGIWGCIGSFAENIAWNYVDGVAVHHAWMNSPGHRVNILRPESRYLGVGIWGTHYTQNFGSCK